MAVDNTVKKVAISKIFPQFCKTFCVFILIMCILFYRKNQKNVLQKKIKDWTFKAYLLVEEISVSPVTEKLETSNLDSR